MTLNEGVIKYNCRWQEQEPVELTDEILASLNRLRTIMFNNKLIGVDQNGLGYGNISIKNRANSFFISGSQTGHLPSLGKQDIALVTDYSFSKNSVDCTGFCKASSESLTHAAVYEASDEIKSVIHIHSYELWKRYHGKLPTTPDYAEYGTIALADEVSLLIKNEIIKSSGMIVLGGHKEGLIAYGKNFSEAGERIAEIRSTI